MARLPEQAREILHFWFGEEAGNGMDVAAERRQRWFEKNPRFDREIAERFGDLLDPARDGQLDWKEPPRGRLALIILLDQFARNIHRDRPEAFAYDAEALALCREGLAAGADRQCGLFERAFFYLPLEHAEDADCQQRSVAEFRDLYAETPADLRATFASFLDYAVRHKEIIDRFGRFPHRNAILGRESTEEERAFLEQPGSSF